MQADTTGNSLAGSVRRHGTLTRLAAPSPPPHPEPQSLHQPEQEPDLTLRCPGECTSRALPTKPLATSLFARRPPPNAAPALNIRALCHGQPTDRMGPSTGTDAAVSPQRQEAGKDFALPGRITGARRMLVSLARHRPAHPGRQFTARRDVSGASAQPAEQQDLAAPSAADSLVASADQCAAEHLSAIDSRGAPVHSTQAAPQVPPEIENRVPLAVFTSAPAPPAADAGLTSTLALNAGRALRDRNRTQVVSLRLPSTAGTVSKAAADERLACRRGLREDPGPPAVLPAATHSRSLHQGQPAALSAPTAAARERAPPQRKRLRGITVSSSSDDSGSDSHSERSGPPPERCTSTRRTRRKVLARGGTQAMRANLIASQSDSPSGADPSRSVVAAAAEDDSGGSCVESEDAAPARRTARPAKPARNRDNNPTVADLRQRCGSRRPDLPRRTCNHRPSPEGHMLPQKA